MVIIPKQNFGNYPAPTRVWGIEQFPADIAGIDQMVEKRVPIVLICIFLFLPKAGLVHRGQSFLYFPLARYSQNSKKACEDGTNPLPHQCPF